MRFFIYCLISIPLVFENISLRQLDKATGNIENTITSGGTKYWDPFWDGYNNKMRGNGWVVSNKHLIREYYYKNGKRKFTTYGDVILEEMEWKLKEDTLIFDQFKFKITKISKDTLIVKDLQKLFGKEYLYFASSKNQRTKPI